LALSQEWPKGNLLFPKNNLKKNYFDFLANYKFQKMLEKVRNKLIFANTDSKTARIRQIRQTKTNLCKIKIGQNPPEIRQKLEARQKYFLPAR
jgi:hypothetical protein